MAARVSAARLRAQGTVPSAGPFRRDTRSLCEQTKYLFPASLRAKRGTNQLRHPQASRNRRATEGHRKRRRRA